MPPDFDTPHREHDSYNDDPFGTIYALRQKARAIVRNHIGDQADTALDEIRDRPPENIIRALRAPKGTIEVVEIRVDGRRVLVRIKACGHPDPDNERDVWDCVRRVVRDGHAA